jgi:uncharacterized protein YjbJ (UPF0337 family)
MVAITNRRWLPRRGRASEPASQVPRNYNTGASVVPPVPLNAGGPNWDQIEKGWQKFKHSAVERWGKLTDEDLAEIDGRRDLLELRIHEVYGCDHDQAHKEVDEWLRLV